VKKAIVLLSGGLDSTTVLAAAINKGFDIISLSFNYGQRHNYEIQCAREIASSYNVIKHQIANIDLGAIGGSALTDDIDVPKNRDTVEMDSEIPITYVPARNTIFLSYALALAEVENTFHIFIGVNALDYSGYPDCRPEYIESFQKMARLATKSGVEETEQLIIHTPLIDLKKSEIIKLGIELGVDYSKTHSCYDPLAKDEPCGKCDACILRIKGFLDAGTSDPLNYPDI
jgi:7-cyano-7-deazaguanine synthase|tara:strand:- start:502 stop:1191 length:690 start_codon:yes stop_codon:yes gene_type:complete